MSIFNDPQYNSIKVLLLVVAVGVCGLFVYDQFQPNSLLNTGKVINTSIGGSTVKNGGTLVIGGGTITPAGCTIAVATDAVTSPAPTSGSMNGHWVTTCGATATTLVPITMSYQWGTTTAYGTTTSPIVTGTATPGYAFPAAPLSGLTCGTTYHYRAVGTNNPATTVTAYGADMTYTPACAPAGPTVVTLPATSITTTTATIHGNITAIGGTSIVSRNFTSGSVVLTPNTVVTTGPVPIVMNRAITGLTCNTTYTYQATATNNAGQVGTGASASFTTLPCANGGGNGNTNLKIQVTTDSSTVTSPTTATLFGTLVSYGSFYPITTTGFDYCVDSAGSCSGSTLSVSTTGLSITTPPTAPITNNVTGLTCNTTYDYRAWASGAGGMNDGGWLSFITAACGGGNETRKPVVSTWDHESTLDASDVSLGGNLVSFSPGSTSAIVGIQVGLGYGTPYSNIVSSTATSLGNYTETIPGMTCTFASGGGYSSDAYHFRAVALSPSGTVLAAGTDIQQTGC